MTRRTRRLMAAGAIGGAALVLVAALAAHARDKHDTGGTRHPRPEPQDESALDAALDASFPASDPVATGLG